MDSFLPNDIAVIVLKYLASKGCESSVFAMIEDIPALKFYVPPKPPDMPRPDYLRHLARPSLTPRLEDILSDYGRAKTMVAEIVENREPFQSPIRSSDTMVTQLKEIKSRLELQKVNAQQHRQHLRDVGVNTVNVSARSSPSPDASERPLPNPTDDNINNTNIVRSDYDNNSERALVLFDPQDFGRNGPVMISDCDEEIEDEEERGQTSEHTELPLQIYNSLMTNSNLHEKLASVINEEVLESKKTKSVQGTPLKGAGSKIESELNLDKFLNELLKDGTNDFIDIIPPTMFSPNRVGHSNQNSMDGGLTNLFQDANSVINSDERRNDTDIKKESFSTVNPDQVQSGVTNEEIPTTTAVHAVTKFSPSKFSSVDETSQSSSKSTIPKKRIQPKPATPCAKSNPVFETVREFVNPKKGSKYSYKETVPVVPKWQQLGRRSIAPKIPATAEADSKDFSSTKPSTLSESATKSDVSEPLTTHSHSKRKKSATPIKRTPEKASNPEHNFRLVYVDPFKVSPSTSNASTSPQVPVSAPLNPSTSNASTSPQVPVSAPLNPSTSNASTSPQVPVSAPLNPSTSNASTSPQVPISAPLNPSISNASTSPQVPVSAPLNSMTTEVEHNSGLEAVTGLSESVFPSQVQHKIYFSDCPVIITGAESIGKEESLKDKKILSKTSLETPIKKTSEVIKNSNSMAGISKMIEVTPILDNSNDDERLVEPLPIVSDAYSPRLRRLIMSARKVRAPSTQISSEKKSLSTPRKKSHVRNLHALFGTPPKVSTTTPPRVSQIDVQPVVRKGKRNNEETTETRSQEPPCKKTHGVSASPLKDSNDLPESDKCSSLDREFTPKYISESVIRCAKKILPKPPNDDDDIDSKSIAVDVMDGNFSEKQPKSCVDEQNSSRRSGKSEHSSRKRRTKVEQRKPSPDNLVNNQRIEIPLMDNIEQKGSYIDSKSIAVDVMNGNFSENQPKSCVDEQNSNRRSGKSEHRSRKRRTEVEQRKPSPDNLVNNQRIEIPLMDNIEQKGSLMEHHNSVTPMKTCISPPLEIPVTPKIVLPEDSESNSLSSFKSYEQTRSSVIVCTPSKFFEPPQTPGKTIFIDQISLAAASKKVETITFHAAPSDAAGESNLDSKSPDKPHRREKQKKVEMPVCVPTCHERRGGKMFKATATATEVQAPAPVPSPSAYNSIYRVKVSTDAYSRKSQDSNPNEALVLQERSKIRSLLKNLNLSTFLTKVHNKES